MFPLLAQSSHAPQHPHFSLCTYPRHPPSPGPVPRRSHLPRHHPLCLRPAAAAHARGPGLVVHAGGGDEHGQCGGVSVGGDGCAAVDAGAGAAAGSSANAQGAARDRVAAITAVRAAGRKRFSEGVASMAGMRCKVALQQRKSRILPRLLQLRSQPWADLHNFASRSEPWFTGWRRRC